MNENLRGSLLMSASMAGFAIEDMFLKVATETLPVGQVLIFFGFGGMVLFAAMALKAGQPVFSNAIFTPVLVFRTVAEIAGRAGHTLALAFAGLSLTSVILQTAPLVVVAGAALFLGERVGWRRWLAIGVGFCGVLLVLRPGTETLTLGALFAVMGMLGFAFRDLATRAAPPRLTNLQMGVYGFGAMVVAGSGLLIWSGGAAIPDLRALGAIALATLFGVVAYNGLTMAMRTGEVSLVTPFRYTRLLFGVALGWLIFAERLDALTLVGAALIVGSGVYSLLRDGRSHRTT